MPFSIVGAGVGAAAPTYPAARRDTTVGSSSAGVWLVLAAILFNAALCFLRTQGVASGSTPQIIICEGLILGLAVLAARQAFRPGELMVGLLLAGYVFALKLLNDGVDVKILRDLTIMYVFFTLGTRAGVAKADLAARWAVGLIIAVGLVELLLPDMFSKLFNIWDYYVSKGVIEENADNFSETTLFVSGNRGADMGRFWFEAVFGSHRVSSVFLEPTSMGNFGIICAAWFLTRFRASPRASMICLGLTFVVIVFGDSRFASLTIFVLIFARLLGLHRWTAVTFLLPIATMAGLAAYALMFEVPGALPRLVNDDFKGRLLYSGLHLIYWNWGHWFGLITSPVETVDTGYAYVINNLGIIPTLLLWWSFAGTRARTEEAQVFRLMLAIYISTALCIGASIFSIKTAALCWLMYGAVSAGSGVTMLDSIGRQIRGVGRALAPAGGATAGAGSFIGPA